MFGWVKRHKKATAIIFALLLIGSCASDKDKDKKQEAKPVAASVQQEKPKAENTSGEKSILKSAFDKASGKEAEEEKAAETNREYKEADATAMLNELEANAMRADKKYKGKYVMITNAKVMNIESDGDYFSVSSPNDDLGLTSITVYPRNKEQKSMLENLNNGQYVTVYGKVTKAGEIMGYRVDLDKVE